MLRAPMSSGREFNPWTALILLAVLIAIGWLFSRVPAPKHESRDASATLEGASAGLATERAHAANSSPGPTPAEPRSAAPAESPVVADHDLRSSWTTLETAMAESQHNGKAVLIDFNADWCGPCQAMKREVFDDLGRGRSVQEAVIPVSIVDRVKEDGENPPDIDELQKRFAVTGFPTLVVFSPQSGRSMVAEGYSSADQALQWILAASKAVH